MLFTSSNLIGLALFAGLALVSLLCTLIGRFVQFHRGFALQAEAVADVALSGGVVFGIIGFLPSSWPSFVQILVALILCELFMHCKDHLLDKEERQGLNQRKTWFL